MNDYTYGPKPNPDTNPYVQNSDPTEKSNSTSNESTNTHFNKENPLENFAKSKILDPNASSKAASKKVTLNRDLSPNAAARNLGPKILMGNNSLNNPATETLTRSERIFNAKAGIYKQIVDARQKMTASLGNQPTEQQKARLQDLIDHEIVASMDYTLAQTNVIREKLNTDPTNTTLLNNQKNSENIENKNKAVYFAANIRISQRQIASLENSLKTDDSLNNETIKSINDRIGFLRNNIAKYRSLQNILKTSETTKGKIGAKNTSVIAPKILRQEKYPKGSQIRKPNVVITEKKLTSLMPVPDNVKPKSLPEPQTVTSNEGELHTLDAVFFRHFENTYSATLDKASTTKSQVESMIENGGGLTAEVTKKQSLLELIKQSTVGKLFKISSEPKSVKLSEFRTLNAARESLNKGMVTSQTLKEDIKSRLDSNLDPKTREYLNGKLVDYESLYREFETALRDLNDATWTYQVELVQDPSIGRQDFDAAAVDIKSWQEKLNVHTAQDDIAIKRTPKPLPKPPVKSDLAQKLNEISRLDAKEKELISSDQALPNQLRRLRNQRMDILKSIIVYATRDTPVKALQEPRDIDLANRVSTELISLEQLLNADSQSDFLKPYADTLTRSFTDKRYALDTQKLQDFSEAVKAIENAFLHQQEVNALLQPGRIASRTAVRELPVILELADTKLKELEKILTDLNKATRNDQKVVIVKETGELVVKKRRRGMSDVGLASTEGKSKRAAETYENILKTIHDMLKNDKLKDNKNLQSTSNNIIESLEKDSRFINAIKKEKNSHIERELDAIKIKIKMSPQKTVTSVLNTMDELLKPPSNTDFQTEFISSYRSIIDKLGNDDSDASDSLKLFNFLSAKFTDPQTSLYEKLQIMNLVDKWINDPYLNNYEVANLEIQIKQLADSAASDGSAILYEASTKLLADLESASKIIPPANEVVQGGKNIAEIVDKIRNGTLTASNDPTLSDDPYKLAVAEFAESITAQNLVYFNGISSAEFKQPPFVGNLALIPKNVTNLTNFVKLSILGNSIPENTKLSDDEMIEKIEQSANVIEFFIKVQEQLIASNNKIIDFEGCVAIESALSSGPVSRLKNSFDILPVETQKAYQKLSILLDSHKKHEKLRNEMTRLQENKTPFIPFTGDYLTDILFALEGNKKLVGDKVNPKRINNAGKLINSIREMQKETKNVMVDTNLPYDLTKVEEIGKEFNDDTGYTRADSFKKAISLKRII